MATGMLTPTDCALVCATQAFLRAEDERQTRHRDGRPLRRGAASIVVAARWGPWVTIMAPRGSTANEKDPYPPAGPASHVVAISTESGIRRVSCSGGRALSLHVLGGVVPGIGVANVLAAVWAVAPPVVTRARAARERRWKEGKLPGRVSVRVSLARFRLPELLLLLLLLGLSTRRLF